MQLDPMKSYGTLVFLKTHDGQIEVERAGVQQPKGQVQVLREDLIVIKVPGHKYWSSRGQQSFAGAEYQAFRPLYRVRDNAVYCEDLWHMDVKTKPTTFEGAHAVLDKIPTKESQ